MSKGRLRVALILPGGVDRSGRDRVIPAFLWLVERLALRHDLTVIALSQGTRPDSYTLRGAPVVDLALPGRSPFPGALSRYGFPRLLRVLRERGPFDVLHAFWAGAPGVLATVSARFLRVPSLVSLGGGELVALPQIGYGMQLSWKGRLQVASTLRLASRLTAATEGMCRLVRAVGREADLVPLGVDPGWRLAPPAVAASPAFRLLHVASLNRVKDQTTLLGALRRIVDAEPRVTLDVVGEDTLGGVVHSECAALGLASRVRFHGPLPFDVLPALYRSADLLLVTSRHEAGPLVVREAASFGVPTVGTEVGQVADWAPEAARAVPIGDASALATAVLELLRDSPRRAELGRRAYELATSFDADDTAARFSEIYAELAAG